MCHNIINQSIIIHSKNINNILNKRGVFNSVLVFAVYQK